MIFERMAEVCGEQTIHTGCTVTKLFHDGRSVQSIELNGERRLDVGRVICSLPLSLVPLLLEPAPRRGVIDLARQLEFRNLILVAVFLEREQVTRSGTVYFPGAGFPFTRVHEPRNRSTDMSPAGKTSLCVEIPCEPGGKVWQRTDNELIVEVVGHLVRLGWIEPGEVLEARVERLRSAYPVLGLGVEQKTQEILDYLGRFTNLEMAGRNAGFLHASLHHMLRLGRDTVATL